VRCLGAPPWARVLVSLPDGTEKGRAGQHRKKTAAVYPGGRGGGNVSFLRRGWRRDPSGITSPQVAKGRKSGTSTLYYGGNARELVRKQAGGHVVHPDDRALCKFVRSWWRTNPSNLFQWRTPLRSKPRGSGADREELAKEKLEPGGSQESIRWPGHSKLVDA